MTDPKPTLYSAAVCPFAHRTRLVLAEKGVEFDHCEIDLRNKPDDFERISPYGKVPVLVRGDDRVWESTVINEYLDEVYPDPPLLPDSPAGRARARIWIDFTNTRLVPAFYKVLMELDGEVDRWRTALTDYLETLDKAMIRYGGDGPFFFGTQLTLVDLTLYPWFERWPVLEHYREFTVPVGLARLRHWTESMATHEGIVGLATDAQYYIDQYKTYANREAGSEDTQDTLRGAPQRSAKLI